MFWIGKFALATLLLLSPSAIAAQVRTDVQVGQLSQIEPFSIAALDKNQKPLPSTQWLHSDVQVLSDLLTELPAQPGSPVLGDLLVRMLLSGGQVPTSGLKLEKLTELRLNGIYALGQLDEVIQLVARSPGGHKDPEIAATAVNALLASAEPQSACSIAKNLNKARGAIFWVQLRAYCLAKDGNIAGAELTAELAMSADPQNPNFLVYINRITTPAEQPIKVSPSSALELAMIRTAKDEVDTADLTLALQVAVGREASPKALGSLFDAYVKGAISRQQMAQRLLAHAKTLETKPPISPNQAEQISPPDAPELSGFEQELLQLKQAKSRTALDRTASLFALAQAPYDPKIRAEALVLLLQPKTNFRQWLALHQLIELESRNLTPDISLKQYAAILARSSLLAGNAKRAKKWFALLETDERSAANLDMPLMALDRRFALKADFLQTKMQGTTAQQNLLASDLLAIQALHRKIPAELRHWVSMRPQPDQDTCNSYQLIALAASAEAKAIAETILRAANIMRSDGFDRLSDICNQALVSALWQVGLKKEARIAAIQWMFARRKMQ